MILHGYWRSGASYRVRIGLGLKGLAYQTAALDLRKGEQKAPAFLAINPQGMTPALQQGETVLTQSPAILEWLEETHPEPPLLPKDAQDRAQVRAMAALIGCDIHPLNNLRVLT
ncbi:MAG: glutathione S-transferase N-terminal domain-containing protein, partial [Brevundimonas aurantiaca]